MPCVERGQLDMQTMLEAVEIFKVFIVLSY